MLGKPYRAISSGTPSAYCGTTALAGRRRSRRPRELGPGAALRARSRPTAPQARNQLSAHHSARAALWPRRLALARAAATADFWGKCGWLLISVHSSPRWALRVCAGRDRAERSEAQPSVLSKSRDRYFPPSPGYCIAASQPPIPKTSSKSVFWPLGGGARRKQPTDRLVKTPSRSSIPKPLANAFGPSPRAHGFSAAEF